MDACLDLTGQTIEVIVGAKKHVPFTIHENVICASSQFFKKAMSGEWSEAKSRSVRLADEDPDVFHIYTQWLYHDTFPVRVDKPGVEGNAEYLLLAKAYVLGDMLQDGNFKDAILDAMVEKTESKLSNDTTLFPVGPVIRHIYDNTMESSEARRLLVDLYTEHGRGDWLRKRASREDLPKEFLYDLVVAVLDKRYWRYPTRAPVPDPCAYHQHKADNSICYKNRLAQKPRKRQRT
ncbi:unnamed protein product [Clonostachys byssicola]|uniref:BTB domain-containing protein n=1 Tax=Clonostachys byssicola TaxID=160290 RepID=A0A9N9UI15_9HYPO|nr:unnamed protein product [Clonostachys byssicola]